VNLRRGMPDRNLWNTALLSASLFHSPLPPTHPPSPYPSLSLSLSLSKKKKKKKKKKAKQVAREEAGCPARGAFPLIGSGF